MYYIVFAVFYVDLDFVIYICNVCKIYCVNLLLFIVFVNLGEGPNYSSNSEDCLLIIIIIIFLRKFLPAYFSYSFSVITMKLHSNDCRVAAWVAMTFCDVAYDRIVSYFQKTRFYKKKTSKLCQYLLFFKSLFFFCSRVQGKADGRHPLRPFYRRFQTGGNRK